MCRKSRFHHYIIENYKEKIVFINCKITSQVLVLGKHVKYSLHISPKQHKANPCGFHPSFNDLYKSLLKEGIFVSVITSLHNLNGDFIIKTI